MRKSAVVLILMQASSDYTLTFPEKIDWERYSAYRSDVPFSDEVIDFLNALSGALMKDGMSRLYPDVVTFAYFCRRANLLKLREQYVREGELRLGRGMLFHIAPSNVPVNFAYSLVAGLLAGNANIVRISSKTFPQVNLITNQLYKLRESGLHDDVAERIVLLRYERSSDAGAFLSSICSVRIIWGGDDTIQTVRRHPIPPRSFDVCFADRYSVAVIRPSAILTATGAEIERLAVQFYNDTYLFDQNACSSPHTIFWLEDGQSVVDAKERFWGAVHKLAVNKYQLQAVMSVDKLTAFYRQAVGVNVRKTDMPDNVVVRSELLELPEDTDRYRCSCGYFSEKTIASIDEIAPVVSIKYQTLSHYGFHESELRDFIIRNRLTGFDRIVPIGETTAFSLTWDGCNLIDTLSRTVTVR